MTSLFKNATARIRLFVRFLRGIDVVRAGCFHVWTRSTEQVGLASPNHGLDETSNETLYQNWKTRVSLFRCDQVLVVKKEFRGPMRQRLRYLVEAERLKRLGVTGAVPRFLFAEPSSSSVYMQFFHGCTLKDFMKSTQDGQRLKNVLSVIEQVLNRIHEMNILLNDVTAKNILVASDDSICFIDFADSVNLTYAPRKLRTFLFSEEREAMRRVFLRLSPGPEPDFCGEVKKH